MRDKLEFECACEARLISKMEAHYINQKIIDEKLT